MKALYEFRCPNEHLTEDFCDSEIREIPCSVCAKTATRIISAGAAFFKIDGFRSDIMTEKWAKTRINNAKRNYDNTGK